MPVALTNAEKQRRWRERNQVVLTERTEDIAEKLIDMEDQKKLRKISTLINDHLKNPNRSAFEKAIALGRVGVTGLNGPLSKKKALESVRAKKAPQNHSWRVEAATKDGRQWSNGVRLDTREEAEAYIEWHTRFQLEKAGYVTAEPIRCDDKPNCSAVRNSRKGRPTLIFPDGECVMLHWRTTDGTVIPVSGL
jgi:hypothetical protein